MANHQTVNAWRRIINATGYSLKGLRAAYKHEQAFRQEVMVLLVLTPLGIWLGETGVERAMLIGSWFIVLIVELLNSAVEAAVDRVGLEHHKLSGRAKDIGSAAVMCSIALTFVVWLLLLLDPWPGA